METDTHVSTAVAQILRNLREQISDNDRAILRALTRRVDLVARVRRCKQANGIDFVDPEREEWILHDVVRINRGRLSEADLRALFEKILALTKREILRREAGGDGGG